MSLKRVLDEENNEKESKKSKHNSPVEDNMTILQKLFKDSPIIHCQNKEGDTPLHHASKTGQISVVKELMKCGVAIDIKNSKKYTPLHLAVTRKHNHEIVNVLLDHGADINAKNEYGQTPLHLAVTNDCVVIVRTLLKRGANVNSLNDSQSSPLHFAVENGVCMIIALLLKCDDIDPGLKNKHGKTALQLFIRRRPRYRALKCLKDHLKKLSCNQSENVDVNDVTEFMKGTNEEVPSPLHIASINGHIEIVEFLLKIGVDVNLPDHPNGFTPLHYAAIHGKDEIVEFLLKNDAEPNLQNVTGDTALHLASRKDDVEIVIKLLEMGAQVNTVNKVGSTPLHIACAYQKVSIAKVLLKLGANANAQINSNGRTPLYLALEWGKDEPEEIVRMFLQNKGYIDLKSKSNKGLTLLDLAIKKNYNRVGRMIAKQMCPEAKITNSIYPLKLFL